MKMKRFLGMILVFCLFISSIPSNAFAVGSLTDIKGSEDIKEVKVLPTNDICDIEENIEILDIAIVDENESPGYVKTQSTNPSFTSISDASEYIKQQIKNRVQDVTIELVTTDDNYADIAKAI